MTTNARSSDPYLVILSALAHTIASTDNPTGVHEAIARAAVTSLGARVARVWIHDPAADTLVAAGSFGVASETEGALLDATTLARGIGIPSVIFTTRAPEFIADSRDDPRWVNSRYVRELGLRGYAGLPLIAGDHVVGVLSVLFDVPRTFDDHDRLVAGLLADHAAITLRIGQLIEQRRRIEALEAARALARAAAHELNNPLTIILGNLELMTRRLGDRPDVLRYVERMRDGAARLTATISGMNRIVRLEMSPLGASPLPPMLDIERSSRAEPD